MWLSVNYRKPCIIYQSTCHLSSPVLPYLRSSRPQGQNLGKTRASREKKESVSSSFFVCSAFLLPHLLSSSLHLLL